MSDKKFKTRYPDTDAIVKSIRSDVKGEVNRGIRECERTFKKFSKDLERMHMDIAIIREYMDHANQPRRFLSYGAKRFLRETTIVIFAIGGMALMVKELFFS